MRLSFIAVTTPEQFRDLLIVRNECRDGLTHYTHEIELSDQKNWMAQCWDENRSFFYEPYLLYDYNWPIGYGLLKWEDGKYWMTAGLVKSYRGKGLSRLLINYITEMGHRDGAEVWIDVLDDNPALYGDIRVGYEFVKSILDGYNTLHVMKHNRDRKLGPEEQRWMEVHGKSVDSLMNEILEVDKISREVYK